MGAPLDGTLVVIYDQWDNPVAVPHFGSTLLPVVTGPTAGFVTSGRFGGGQPPAGAGDLVPIGASYINGDYALKVDVLGVTFTGTIEFTEFEPPFAGNGNQSTTGATAGYYDRAGNFAPIIGPPGGSHTPAFAYNVHPSAPALPVLPAGSLENVVGVVLRTPAPSDVYAFGTASSPIYVALTAGTIKDPFLAAFPSTGIASGFLYDPNFSYGPAADDDMAPARVYDVDSDEAGKELVLGVSLRKELDAGSKPLGTTPHPASDTATHPMRTEETRPSESAVARVDVAGEIASVPQSTTLLVPNSSRRGVILFNEGGTPVYVKLGSTCLPTDYTVRLGPFGIFVVPEPVYTGEISASKNGAGTGGPVQVTETRPPSV